MTFWKPGATCPDIQFERTNEAQNPLLFDPYSNQTLPISKMRKAILYALDNYRTVIVVGETGSGKTTQIPQFLHKGGWTQKNRCVVCTQPRRMAAISVAARVAKEMNFAIGQEVGYAVRFDEKCSHVLGKTFIKFVTDGLLLREMMNDPLLSKYSVVMLDEAHERTIQNDVLFGLLKKVLKRRNDLKLIISSATLEAEEFKRFFESKNSSANQLTATIISIQGRQHPVDILYTKKPVNNYITAAVEALISIHKTEPKGDVLVFMPGSEEIDAVTSLLKDSDLKNIIILPLHSKLPHHQQMAVFQRAKYGIRRVIVATNVAETSITIDGVRYVIDSCFVKLPFYDPNTGLESLITTVTSKASCTQRAGRAGRIFPGKCLRLMTEDHFLQLLPEKTIPEIKRADLSSSILLLKALGIKDLVHFDFLSPPTSKAMIRALELLYSLKAIDENVELTEPIGRQMAEMPLEPRLAKAVISSPEFGCQEQMMTIAAMLSVQNPFEKPRNSNLEKLSQAKAEFAVQEGDHITLLNVYNSFVEANDPPSFCREYFLNFRSLKRATEVRAQISRYSKFHNRNTTNNVSTSISVTSSEDPVSIRKCLVSGYFSNSAKLCSDGRYRTIRDDVLISFHGSSVLSQFGAPVDFVIFHELVRTTELFASEISSIDPKWLIELAPHFFHIQDHKIPSI